MKIKLIALSLLLAPRLFATTLDLGPDGTTYQRTVTFDQFNGTGLNGQHVSVDFNFTTSVHLFSNTFGAFLVGIDVLLSQTATGFIDGSGYLLSADGSRMGEICPLGSASGGNEMFVAVFPLIDGGLKGPLDFYGVHFDLDLPLQDGCFVSGSGLQLAAEEFIYHGYPSGMMRIGPHVPDSGSTFSLFVLALLTLMLRMKSVR